MSVMKSTYGGPFDREALITLKAIDSAAASGTPGTDGSVTVSETPIVLNTLSQAYWDNNEVPLQGAEVMVNVTAIDNAQADETYELLFEVDTSSAFTSTTGPQNFLAGFQEDATGGPSYVDETADLASATANDVAFFPAGSGINDAFYFGFDRPFTSINLTVGTAGAGTYTVTWEYYDGSWVDLATNHNLTDGTSALKSAGAGVVSFDRPSNWTPTTINGKSYYWVRVIRDAGTVTTDPLGTVGQADGVDGLAVGRIVLDRDAAVKPYRMPLDFDVASKLVSGATHMRVTALLGGTSPSVTYHAYLFLPLF